MKTCMVCHEEKPLDQFKMRVRPPIQPYAACRACEPMAYRKNKSIKDEYDAMRNKAVSLRKLSANQDVEVFRRVSAGETKKALSQEFGVAPKTIGKAFLRGRAAI